jgi:predicted nucleic acid-binding protein
MPPILIDTNVLVYAFDYRSKTRQAQAISVLDTLGKMGIGRLSVQCLSEFFNATCNKIKILTLEEAYEQIQMLAQGFITYSLTSSIVIEAVRGVRDYQLSFWDSQLWASAKLNQIPTIFSEDFRSGSVIENVKFINPFQTDFSIDTWTS